MIIKSCQTLESGDALIWKLNSHTEIGVLSPVIIGNPQIVKDASGNSFSFNGENDGLIMPVNPIAGWKEFTVEILFKPASDGNPEQRFVHFQDVRANRGLVEIRMTSEGKWCLDTYLHIGLTEEGHTLIDRSKEHPCDEWYWAALVYDGETMTHFINGVEELSGKIKFGPMDSGLISFGVRLNQLFWFKGQISEVRFNPKPLEAKELQNTLLKTNNTDRML